LFVAYLHVGQEQSTTVDLYYEDVGSGTPVVLIHGWPLSGHAWEKQAPVLRNSGFRVITYDRRGFGASSHPASGYDCDTFTNDLHVLLTTLDLHDTVLVGFAMGTGEVVRYLATHGSERVSKAILLAPLQPFLLQTPDNPDGMPGRIFDDIMQAIVADRPAYIMEYLNNCYSVDLLGGSRVSNDAIHLSWTIAAGASALGTLESVTSWLTDFRRDLPRLDVPVLVVQGDQDRILPYRHTGKRLLGLIKTAQFVVIEGGPHAITWTHAEEVNLALLDFLDR
jgi:non-heme chloroperoxidase